MAANPGSSQRPPESPKRSEAELESALRKLDASLERLERHRKAADEGARGPKPGYAAAMKLSSEFLASILVGALVGWGIDRLLGISPWAMIVFVLLGFCAGVVTVVRSAGRMSGTGEAEKK
jgi:ATP synthase protein I